MARISCRRCSTASTTTCASPARRSSARWCRHPVRHGGGGPAPRQRHAVRPVRLDLEPRHRQGAARRQGPPVGRHQRQLELSVHTEAPFGGYKMSGIGRELGMAALDLYTETKNVFIDISLRRASTAASSRPAGVGSGRRRGRDRGARRAGSWGLVAIVAVRRPSSGQAVTAPNVEAVATCAIPSAEPADAWPDASSRSTCRRAGAGHHDARADRPRPRGRRRPVEVRIMLESSNGKLIASETRRSRPASGTAAGSPSRVGFPLDEPATRRRRWCCSGRRGRPVTASRSTSSGVGSRSEPSSGSRHLPVGRVGDPARTADPSARTVSCGGLPFGTEHAPPACLRSVAAFGRRPGEVGPAPVEPVAQRPGRRPEGEPRPRDRVRARTSRSRAPPGSAWASHRRSRASKAIVTTAASSRV